VFPAACFPNILVEVRLLFRQAERDPLGKSLMMAVAQGPVSIFRAQQGTQGNLKVTIGGRISQRRQIDEPPENSGNLRKRPTP